MLGESQATTPDAVQLFMQHPRLALAIRLLDEHDEARKCLEPLSPAQLRTAVYVAKGLGNKEIAHMLKISAHTVHDQLRRAMEKLEVSSRAELAVIVNRAGLG